MHQPKKSNRTPLHSPEHPETEVPSTKSQGETVIRRLTLLFLTVVASLSGATLASHAQSQSLLTRHTREVTLNGQAPLVGHLPATQSMRIVLVLPHRNQA